MAARGQTPSRRPRRAGSESGEASTERYRRERGGIRQGAASTCFRNHDHSRSDVGGEIDRVPQLHRSGIVNFDVITRAENVEFFPRARNTETEAGAAVELLAAGDAIRGQVEFHKFATAVAALAIERHRVAFLVIRSNVEAGGAAGRGTDRGEIERALGQIKTSDAKDVAMNDRVLRIEQADKKTGFLDRVERSADADVLHTRNRLRLGELDLIDNFEIGRVENKDVVPEDVQIFSVGRKAHLAAETEAGLILVFGHVSGADHFLLRKIDNAELRLLANVEAVLLFFDGAEQDVSELTLRIDGGAANPVLLGRSFVQRE